MTVLTQISIYEVWVEGDTCKMRKLYARRGPKVTKYYFTRDVLLVSLSILYQHVKKLFT